MNRATTAVAVLLTAGMALLSACAPSERITRTADEEAALPPVPEVRGPLEVQLTYPPPGALKPDVDSTFVFGTVGTGEARLTINGQPVEVAPNGAFLAYVPVPEDGTYTLVARADGSTDTAVFTYATPPPEPPNVVEFAEPLTGVVVGGKDTLATGSESAHAAPTPGGDRKWFFPVGTRLTITGRQDNYLRVQFTENTIGWIDSAAVSLGDSLQNPQAVAGPVSLEPHPRYVDVRIPVDYAAFRIDPQLRTLGVTVYDRAAPADGGVQMTDGVVDNVAWIASSPDSARLRVDLEDALWGYKVFYNEAGDLVVRVRRPPEIDPDQPLRGIRVLVDAGHPPGGAIGPTGLTEAEANLEISRRIADLLRARGAEVLMIRETLEPLVSETSVAQELWARVDTAVALNTDLMISVHNNAFPEGVNPFEHFGTETYYYHPFARPLAEELLEEIVAVTGLPNLGAKQRSLALVRPMWFPSTLTESLFMMFPRQEAALRNPAFLDRLAAAHVRGIEEYLRQYLEISDD